LIQAQLSGEEHAIVEIATFGGPFPLKTVGHVLDRLRDGRAVRIVAPEDYPAGFGPWYVNAAHIVAVREVDESAIEPPTPEQEES